MDSSTHLIIPTTARVDMGDSRGGKLDGGPHDLQALKQVYTSTNALTSALKSSGFESELLLPFSGAGNSAQSHWALKVPNSTPTAAIYPSSSDSTSIPPPSSSAAISESSRPASSFTPGRLAPANAPFLPNLDAFATLLDSNDSKVAVSTTGACIRPGSPDGTAERKLVLDLVICGNGPFIDEHKGERLNDPLPRYVHMWAAAGIRGTDALSLGRSELAGTSSSDSLPPSEFIVIQPLKTVAQRGGIMPLLEHTQIINHYIQTLSSMLPAPGNNGRAHLQTSNKLVQYITASHANKVVNRVKDNAMSTKLWKALCHVPLPSSLPPPSTSPSPSGPITGAGATTGPSPPSRPPARHSRKELSRDTNFLERFIPRSPFVAHLRAAGLPISHLTHAAQSLFTSRGLHRNTGAPSPGCPPQAPSDWYEGSTPFHVGIRDEFHILLVFLLTHEKGYLGRLVSFTRLLARVKAASSADAPGHSKDRDVSNGYGDAKDEDEHGGNLRGEGRNEKKGMKRMLKKLSGACSKLTRLGVLLRDMLATSAFKTHMHHIQPFLHDLHLNNPDLNLAFDSGTPSTRTNVDFNHHMVNAGLGPLDDGEVGPEALIAVYTKWMSGLVEHLEAALQVQTCLQSTHRLVTSDAPASGCDDAVGKERCGPPVEIGLTLIELPMGPGSRRDGTAATLRDEGGRLAQPGKSLKRKREPLPTPHPPPPTHDSTLPRDSIPWRDILLDAYASTLDTPSPTSTSSDTHNSRAGTLDPYLFDGHMAADVVETILTDSARPSPFALATLADRWSSAASTERLLCPEACIASLLVLSAHSKIDLERGEPTYLIGVSSPICPSCLLSLFPALGSARHLLLGEPWTSSDTSAVAKHQQHTFSTTFTLARKSKRNQGLGLGPAESVWFGALCTFPPWLPHPIAESAVREAQGNLVKLVNEELLHRCGDDMTSEEGGSAFEGDDDHDECADQPGLV